MTSCIVRTLFWIAGLLVASVAGSDGFVLSGGRFVGRVVEISLTASQIERLAESSAVSLTDDQRDQLAVAAGVAPSELLVYETRAGENDCTCGAYNVGLRFSADRLEVPVRYLVSDQEAARMASERASF